LLLQKEVRVLYCLTKLPDKELIHIVGKTCALLGYDAVSCGNCLPTFRDNVSMLPLPASFLLGLLNLEDGTDTLSRNAGKQLPHDAA
jgi:hypothetical protein